jgi:predicted transcriptional regulator
MSRVDVIAGSLTRTPTTTEPVSGMRKIDLTSFTVATSETARQINRRIALNFIRRHQPMSRADLARHSGLQRSTVSAIIDQLIAEGWVTEGAVGRAPRGRRPRFLHLNVERAGILGVELRPETTTLGLAGIDARFVAQTSWPTPRDPVAFVKELAKAVSALRAAHPGISCEGMGVSLPGRVDREGRLVFAPNLGWGRVDLRQMLETAVGLPVNVENAANACARAQSDRGHRLRRPRRGAAAQWSARPRRRLDGRRVRARQHRR